jgi:ELWxxDGT repeat protein
VEPFLGELQMLPNKKRKLSILALLLAPVLLAATGLAGTLEAQAPVSEVARQQVLQAYGKLPLRFEANQDQTDAQVKFLARGGGYTLFLTSTEAVFALRQPQEGGDAEAVKYGNTKRRRPERQTRKPATVLRMKLVGANPQPLVSGLGKLAGRSNYFIGKDPKKWRTKAPHYAKVRYGGVYPGVDLVYYGNQRQLEYDFIVAPGADPKTITLRFAGAEKVEVAGNGNLMVHAAAGQIQLQKPFVYQEVEGVRQQIPGGYVLKDKHQVAFEVGAYDTSKPLIIDPVLVYSTYLGGSNQDCGDDIVVDDAGNAYISGATHSADFPSTAGAYQESYQGDRDAYVAKLSPDGSQLLYCTYLGGSDGDYGYAVAVDDSGNAYVTGDTEATDFPTTPKSFQPGYGGGHCDAFIAKLSSDGSALVYSTYLGGSDYDWGSEITVDSSGNAYLAGDTSSTNFPTQNPLQAAYGGGYSDAFVAKLNSAGSALIYSTYLGGSDYDWGLGIAVDSSGNAYVAGETRSTDFPTQNPLQAAYGGGYMDAYVAKVNADGSALVYSTYLGGSGHDYGCAIGVDDAGNAYVSGDTSSTDFPTQNALQPNHGGGTDAFVTKLNAAGSALVYSTYLGGSDSEGAWKGFAVDGSGDAFVTGGTGSTDLPVTDNALQPSLAGVYYDAFVVKLNPSGSEFYSTYFGGSMSDRAYGIAVDASGNAYLTGETRSTDFPTQNPLQPDHAGGYWDAFVAKLALADVRLYNTPKQSSVGLTKLLKDIRVDTWSADVQNFAQVGETLFFAADDGYNGVELWKTDGTEPNTMMVKDIMLVYLYGSKPRHLTNVNGTLFFVANNYHNGYELWKSDGTEAGTALVKDILPGRDSSDPTELTNVSGTLFFKADDGVNGRELWKSDGTEAGTVPVDINPGSASSNPWSLTEMGGTLYFGANDGTNGSELWKSDPVTEETVMVKDINPDAGNSSPYYLTEVNGTLFFHAYGDVNGCELWKSDGTGPNTVMVKDILPGSGHSYPTQLTNVSGTLFFMACNETGTYDLWKSNGTEAGTVMVKSTGLAYNSYRPLTEAGGTLFFRGNDANGWELWKSDGTEAGTVMVKDINPTGSSLDWIPELTNVNGTLFFAADNGYDANGVELWKSDGTEAGTVMVKDIWPGYYRSSSPEYLTNFNGTLFFQASNAMHGSELWKSDGTEPNTVLVKDVDSTTRDSFAAAFVGAAGKAFFVANDGVVGRELWTSDGTQAGTALVKDIRPGSDSSLEGDPYYGYLTSVDDTVFFRAHDGVNGQELWKSDGTEAGTGMVKDIWPGSNSSDCRYLTNFNGTLFFAADDGVNGWELWKSDGTEAGTFMVKDIVPGPGSSGAGIFDGLVNVNGTLFFAATDGVNGLELCKSNGTEAGTGMVKDILPGDASSWPRELTNVSGMLFFMARNATGTYDLWKSNGTEAGTVMVKNVGLSYSSHEPWLFTEAGGILFFRGYDAATGWELWKSDGTEAGTVVVKDIRPGPQSSFSWDPELTNVNGTLFFNPYEGTHGQELWKSDGTEAGTVMVKDIWPGTHTSYLRELTNVNGMLLFSADDGSYRMKLWRSDGTEAGTVMAVDVWPSDLRQARYLTNVNGTLYFQGYDLGTGREPWIWRLVVPAATPTGHNVLVEPVDTTTGEAIVTLDFADVCAPGTTSVTSTTPGEGQEPPPGFMFGDPCVVFDIATTAGFTGLVQVCFDYSGFSFDDEPNLVLLHSTDGVTWVDITTSLDTDNDVICGVVDSFSYFGIFVKDLDADDDGVPDTEDNCPLNYNLDQLDGDGDGVGDECDTCPAGLPIGRTLTYYGDLLATIGTSTELAAVLTDENSNVLSGVPVSFRVTYSGGTPCGQCSGTTDEQGLASCSLTLLKPDVYTVTVESGELGCADWASTEVLLVVYDPSVPRATGGGFIFPDADSTLPAQTSEDKANFGFIVRVNKNQAAAGNLQFQYETAGIELKSRDMTWYTLSTNKAMFQGEGTINGEGLYTFRVHAADGDLAGHQPDAFDIKIWDGTDTEADPFHRAKNDLAGGNIVIHKK